MAKRPLLISCQAMTPLPTPHTSTKDSKPSKVVLLGPHLLVVLAKTSPDPESHRMNGGHGSECPGQGDRRSRRPPCWDPASLLSGPAPGPARPGRPGQEGPGSKHRAPWPRSAGRGPSIGPLSDHVWLTATAMPGEAPRSRMCRALDTPSNSWAAAGHLLWLRANS